MKKAVGYSLFGVSMLTAAMTHAQNTKVIDNINHNLIEQLNVALQDLPEDPQKTIDVMVYFQPSYATVMGGEQFVVEKVQGLFDRMNALNESEGFNESYRVVAVTPTVSVPEDVPVFSYDDENGVRQPGASSLAARAIGNIGNPEYDTRLLYKPDMVTYIRDYNGERFLGLAANTGANTQTLEGFYASQTVLDELNNYESTFNTLAHEIGHNWGGGHEEAENPNTGDPRNRAVICGSKRTIMYSAGGNAGFYSNPDVALNGEVCGDADEADNHAVISENLPFAHRLVTSSSVIGTVSFDSTEVGVSEGNDALLTIIRDGDLSEAARAMVLVSSDTAQVNVDYTDGFYDVLFEAGETTKQVAVTTLIDGVAETDEMLTASLVFPARLDVVQGVAQITIEGNTTSGNPGIFSLNTDTLNITEGETKTFTIERTGGSDTQVVVDVQTQLMSASFTDVGSINESVLFDVGETEKTFNLVTLNDELVEDTETLVINITSLADVNVSSMTVNIGDDDSGIVNRGEFDVVAPTSVTEGDTFEVTINRSGGEGEVDIVLEANYSNSTADSTQTLSFADGETSKTVSITATDNSTDEANYSVTLTLSSDDEGAVFGINAVSVTVADNDEAPATPSQPSSSGDSGGGSIGYGVFALIVAIFACLRRRQKYLAS